MPFLTESTVKSLHVGDAIVTCGDRRVVIERKTICDLLGSIHDGRFHEQSVRLAAENVPIVYIIEQNSRGGIPPEYRKKVSSVLATLAVQKGFYVLPSESVEQTAELIQALAHKVGTADAVACRPVQYSAVVKAQKKANITKQNIDQIMLKSVPGVSEKYAQVILAKFGSLRALLAALHSDGTCLDDLRVANSDRFPANVKRQLFELLGP